MLCYVPVNWKGRNSRRINREAGHGEIPISRRGREKWPIGGVRLEGKGRGQESLFSQGVGIVIASHFGNEVFTKF